MNKNIPLTIPIKNKFSNDELDKEENCQATVLCVSELNSEERKFGEVYNINIPFNIANKELNKGLSITKSPVKTRSFSSDKEKDKERS